MRLYLDTEFTGLHRKTTLISIGVLSDDDRWFYAELDDYHRGQVDPWIQENVIHNLIGLSPRGKPNTPRNPDHCYGGNKASIGAELRRWLAQFDAVEVWGDCLSHDWVLFCDLFGGAMALPKNVYYIPFDLATAFKIKGVDPDVSREEYAGLDGPKHNAMHDARVIRECVRILGV